MALAGNRLTSTLLHVVLPTSSLLAIAIMFWVGFSGQSIPVAQTDSDAGGVEGLTYATQLGDGATLQVQADSALFLQNQIRASGVSGVITYPDGRLHQFNSERANAGWDLSFAGFENGVLVEKPQDGSNLTVWFESGSAGSNGLIGRKVQATRSGADDSTQRLVADQLFLRLDGSSANISGNARFYWQGDDANDSFSVSAEGFELIKDRFLLQSDGPAEFQFIQGAGRTGQFRVIDWRGKSTGRIEFSGGVEVTYLEPPPNPS
ncbi:MAG: hypothetical protein OXE84_04630 [Rhodobacteraceae bacterium]|nr:hypothetical protein [Paracoccaceae bacterium]MCY4195944.1 hypothetical protein [Paracoccaceae bacterium]MCY4327985.1 hypothetical protein [Paracoccaceae bacterium]